MKGEKWPSLTSSSEMDILTGQLSQAQELHVRWEWPLQLCL